MFIIVTLENILLCKGAHETVPKKNVTTRAHPNGLKRHTRRRENGHATLTIVGSPLANSKNWRDDLITVGPRLNSVGSCFCLKEKGGG